MSTLLRLFLIASAIFIVVMMITRPRQVRAWGRKGVLVGLIYAAVIVVSALLRITFGWGS